MKRRNFIKIMGFSVLVIFLLQINLFSANRLDKWEDEKAYRPYPVLFLHGFAKGSPLSWEKAIPEIEKYFTKRYYIPKSPIDEHLLVEGYLYDGKNNPANRYYLEIISFFNPDSPPEQQLIDRNSSVDTYDAKDPYVKKGKRNIGDLGWADKLDPIIANLLSNYSDESFTMDKLLIVAHSMGGLAGRECVSNTKYSSYTNASAESLILTGTANLGTKLANVAEGLSKFSKVRKFLPSIRWVVRKQIDLLNAGLESWKQIDIDGGAIHDMTTDSEFLTGSDGLNKRNPCQGVKYFVIAGMTDEPFWALVNLCLFQGKGDGIVSLKSQKGETLSEDVFPLENEGSVVIWANHFNECTNIATSGELIKFLDYTTPVLEIDKVNGEIPSEDPNAPTEITGASISIECTLSDEYLPADTKIEWAIYEGQYGYIPIGQGELENKFFPLSPVEDGKIAWFEENIFLGTLEGESLYRIGIKAVNLGEKESAEKMFYVMRISTPELVDVIINRNDGWVYAIDLEKVIDDEDISSLGKFFQPKDENGDVIEVEPRGIICNYWKEPPTIYIGFADKTLRAYDISGNLVKIGEDWKRTLPIEVTAIAKNTFFQIGTYQYAFVSKDSNKIWLADDTFSNLTEYIALKKEYVEGEGELHSDESDDVGEAICSNELGFTASGGDISVPEKPLDIWPLDSVYGLEKWKSPFVLGTGNLIVSAGNALKFLRIPINKALANENSFHIGKWWVEYPEGSYEIYETECTPLCWTRMQAREGPVTEYRNSRQVVKIENDDEFDLISKVFIYCNSSFEIANTSDCYFGFFSHNAYTGDPATDYAGRGDLVTDPIEAISSPVKKYFQISNYENFINKWIAQDVSSWGACGLPWPGGACWFGGNSFGATIYSFHNPDILKEISLGTSGFGDLSWGRDPSNLP